MSLPRKEDERTKEFLSSEGMMTIATGQRRVRMVEVVRCCAVPVVRTEVEETTLVRVARSDRRVILVFELQTIP